MAIIAAEVYYSFDCRAVHEKTFFGSFNLLKSQDLNCTLMFGKIRFRLSQKLATSYMVLIKLFPSAAPIHPHHTINAEMSDS